MMKKSVSFLSIPFSLVVFSLASVQGAGQEISGSGNQPSNNASNASEVEVQAKKDMEEIKTSLRNMDFPSVYKQSTRFIKKYEHYDSISIQEYVVAAMGHAANAVRDEGDSKEALKLYTQLEKRYSQFPGEKFQFWVSDAIYCQGLIYRVDFGDLKKSVSNYKRVQKLYGDSADIEILRTVAYAMYQEGLAHELYGKVKDAKKCYHAVIDKFDQYENKRLEQPITNAKERLAKMRD